MTRLQRFLLNTIIFKLRLDIYRSTGSLHSRFAHCMQNAHTQIAVTKGRVFCGRVIELSHKSRSDTELSLRLEKNWRLFVDVTCLSRCFMTYKRAGEIDLNKEFSARTQARGPIISYLQKHGARYGGRGRGNQERNLTYQLASQSEGLTPRGPLTVRRFVFKV